jgi:formylmethanofuran dehydrogenase subunit A
MLGILNGQVYDPLHGVNGEVRDLWVKDGRIVAAEEVERDRAEIIHADGMVIMPGGVDIHSHIVGPMVNAARKMCPEDHRSDVCRCPASSAPGPSRTLTRSGVGRTVPTTFVTGYRYIQMGYTTVMEAAMPALLARHAHEELGDTPLLDKGAYTLMGNNRFLLRCLQDGEREKARDYVAWLLGATKGYAVKIVNAGGVESWKAGRRLSGLDDQVAGLEVTPRQIILALADISAELGLPHGPHVHTNGLGQPGDAKITLQTIAALEGRRAHIAHLQFSSYGGGDGHPFSSAATEVAQAINAHPNITTDIGQIIFGPTTTLTADAPLEQYLHQLSGHKWLNHDIEEETGGGVVPMNHERHNPVNAIQWCIGLELLLQITDPWQVFLSTDHPNGGPFTAYPEVIRLAMDRNYRAEVLQTLPPRVRPGTLPRSGGERTVLADLEREYSLYEIAVITRAGTARALGLQQKGHLGIGADADIAVYAPQADPAAMFSRARFVVKGGRIVVRDGELVDAFPGRTFCVAPAWDVRIEQALRAHFETSYTIAYDNYPVQDEYVPYREVVPCT